VLRQLTTKVRFPSPAPTFFRCLPLSVACVTYPAQSQHGLRSYQRGSRTRRSQYTNAVTAKQRPSYEYWLSSTVSITRFRAVNARSSPFADTVIQLSQPCRRAAGAGSGRRCGCFFELANKYGDSVARESDAFSTVAFSSGLDHQSNIRIGLCDT
jgi:hypothetical protein